LRRRSFETSRTVRGSEDQPVRLEREHHSATNVKIVLTSFSGIYVDRSDAAPVIARLEAENNIAKLVPKWDVQPDAGVECSRGFDSMAWISPREFQFIAGNKSA